MCTVANLPRRGCSSGKAARHPESTGTEQVTSAKLWLSWQCDRPRLEVPSRVEYLARQARITDIDRLYALCADKGVVPGGESPIDAIGLMRQLVYLPNASVALVEAGRQLAGGAVLGLRPSVRVGGFVGTVDLLVIADGHDTDRVADLLIEELLLSARRKGCTSVEVILTPESDNLSNWQSHGFTKAATTTYRTAVVVRAPISR
jgi:hypothetical protein